MMQTLSFTDTTSRLADACRVFSGVGVQRRSDDGSPGRRFPVIGIRDLRDSAVAPLDALELVEFPASSKVAAYEVREDDVLLSGRGTLLKFSLVGGETKGAIASGNIIIVRPGPGVVGRALFALLSSDVFRPKIEVLRRGATTLLSLSPKDLGKLEINLPPLGEQQKIAALVKDAQIAHRAALEAAEIRRSLARRLIDARLFGDNQKS